MMPDPTVVSMTVRAEHELRVRKAQRFGEYEAEFREGRGRTERVSLRRRAGTALVSLGHRLQGAAPSPAAGDPAPVAG